MQKIKQVIRIRVIEDESGTEKVEVIVRGSQEELQNLIYSAMQQDDSKITNVLIGAINAFIYKRMNEDRKARLN